MFCRSNRRWLCLLTALLFTVSGVARARAIIDATMNTPNVAMESSTPDHGMDCGGGDKAAHAACVAMCATAIAILSEPVEIPFAVAMHDNVAATEVPLSSGRPSPEPPPPKH